MEKINLTDIFACPKCKTPLNKHIKKGQCPKCGFLFKKENSVWHFLKISKKNTSISQKQYEHVHDHKFIGPQDGSYEILASFAKGNKTLNIACGQGDIEKLAPNTVGLDFSYNALKRAKQKGVKNLILADAHALPFKNNSFDITLSAGNLEHFDDPQKAIFEMARVSKIQILTVHRQLPIPFYPIAFKLISVILKINHQPIEKPMNTKDLEKMISKAGLKIIFKGVWTIPVNHGRVIKFLPELKNVPACSFIISIKR